jgi:hypothetical protein
MPQLWVNGISMVTVLDDYMYLLFSCLLHELRLGLRLRPTPNRSPSLRRHTR